MRGRPDHPGLGGPRPGALPAALAFALLLWLPLLAFELLSPYPVSHFALSPVLRRAFAWAALVCGGVAVGLGLAAGAAARWPRGVGAAASPDGRRLRALGAAAAASLLFLLGYARLQAWLAPLPPALGLGAAVLAAGAAALVAGAVVAKAARARLLLAAWALAPTAAWLVVVARRFEVLGAPFRSAILGASALALCLAIGRAGEAFGGRLRRRAVGAAVLGLALGIPAAAVVLADPTWRPPDADARASPRPDAPNVIVLMIDTIRVDHTSAGGYAVETTPFLERAARGRATTFTQATAAGSSTRPSVKSLFTGLPPWHGVLDIHMPPPPDAWTLARAFRAAGYRTAGISANGLVDEGFTAGFDEFRTLAGHQYYAESFFLYDLLSRRNFSLAFRTMERLRLHKETAPTLGRLASRWLEERGDRPFFLYLHFLDPHWPYYERGFGLIPEEVRDAPRPYRHTDVRVALGHYGMDHAALRAAPRFRHLIGRYDEELRFVDREIRRLLDELERLGLDESTLVVVVGDHGEEFLEHGGFSHGHDVYPELVRVPLLFLWPPAFEGRVVTGAIEAPVSLMDVLPTLTDLLGLPAPPSDGFGCSLRPLLEGSGERACGPVVSNSAVPGRVRMAWRVGDLKVRFAYSPEVPLARTEDVEVYDVGSDPQGLRPLPAADPRVAPLVERARRELLLLLAASGRRGDERDGEIRPGLPEEEP